jgi:hypothetical protein
MKKIRLAIEDFQDTFSKDEGLFLVMYSGGKAFHALSGAGAELLASIISVMESDDNFEKIIRAAGHYYDKYKKQKQSQEEKQRPAE